MGNFKPHCENPSQFTVCFSTQTNTGDNTWPVTPQTRLCLDQVSHFSVYFSLTAFPGASGKSSAAAASREVPHQQLYGGSLPQAPLALWLHLQCMASSGGLSTPRPHPQTAIASRFCLSNPREIYMSSWNSSYFCLTH